MSDGPKLTPMMERYLEVKRENPGALLLFRMGDFYELFHEDAQLASRVLGLTLTSRDKGSPNPVPMAGFPFHQLDAYLQKLVRAGIRAAICDQVEDPKLAKGLVRREVTRVVTPGTLTDDSLLDPREHNWLAGLVPAGPRIGLAWLELSSGKFVCADVEPSQLPDELARLRPAECLLPEGTPPPVRSDDTLGTGAISWCPRPAWCFAPADCRRLLIEHFGTAGLEGFDVDPDSPGVTAAGALLQYVQETQRSGVRHVVLLETYRRGTHLIVDEATRRSLELTRVLRDGRREGSLLDAIDETVTPMGARLLAERLSSPLTDPAAIERRLEAVSELVADPVWTRSLRDLLKEAYDLERLTARAATGRVSPRDLGRLAQTLALLPRLKASLSARRSDIVRGLEADLDLCADLRAELVEALVDEPPIGLDAGGVFRPGWRAELDELRELARGGKEWMASYQAREIERTGIPNLKIGFNRVFGYYLETTAAQASKVPPDYVRKQTLKNQERFVTPELKQYEDKVLRAEERALGLELELFHALRERVAREAPRLKRAAGVLAETDVLAGLAVLAASRNYCRPEIVADPVLEIRAGRHPVLDKLRPSGEFVPNDVLLGPDAGRIQIVTGPNMAGKSTYIRQAALIVLLAQMGSFVPAKSARIGAADRIFARVGASDELSRGQSTFMVEMTETARILNSATPKSLVVLDEIGRGTSTYDGISLAWAVTEHLHDVVEARTLFATHYHELTELTQTLPAAANWNVAVREDKEDIVFLHRIVPGPADKSYGIHVASLAGVPIEVVRRARAVLAALEAQHVDETGRPKVPDRPPRSRRERQLSLFAEAHPVLDEIRRLEPDALTPEDALQHLKRLRADLLERR